MDIRTTSRPVAWLRPPRASPARQRGVHVVEFVLVLLVLLPVMFGVVEVVRLSLADHALARATQRAAVAAARNPADCERRARDAFENRITRWLFDANDDGRIAFVAGDAPNRAAGEEVRLDIFADADAADGDILADFVFDQTLCGNPRSWIRVEASVPIRSAFGLGDMVRRHESWALNQERW